MVDLPHGTVTFLFTDIEGSTRLWRDYPVAMEEAYTRHDAILLAAIADHGGVTYKFVGDALQAAFPAAPGAVNAALQAQQGLAAESWDRCGLPDPLGVRMALHAGAVDPDANGDYRSPLLNHVAQLIAASHGGQVLLSATARELVREELPEAAALRDLGEFRFSDLERPSRVFQLLHPTLEQRFPPLRAMERPQHNLPLLLTTFHGREREVVEIAAVVRRDDARLVTLTGPGGTGKTRLALQVAGDLREAFRDGVWLVELAAITDPALVPSAVAHALGLREDGARPLSETLQEHLRDKDVLLVLDNCEHVLPAASFVEELLAVAPGVTVLATSREPLHLRGEREIAVPPLTLPPSDRLLAPSELTRYEAVQLFVARAQEVQASFAIDDANAAAVAEICVRLDGLPLAIELAAARIKLLPAAALLRRLEQRLPLLTSGAHNVPERQRTLRAAIAWSHDLLAAEEQALFRHLAVFAGGCTLDAAEWVIGCWDDRVIGDEVLSPNTLSPSSNTLDLITSLLDKSLVKSEAQEGEPRFVMLETIHEFAREMLGACGEAAALARRHAQFYRDLAERAEPALLSGNDAARWLNELDVEHENVRAALSWSLRHDPATAIRLAGAVSRFWMARGHLTEGRDWLERAMAVAPAEDPQSSAKVQDRAGRIAWMQGDYARSVSLHEESLAYWRTTDDEVEIGWAETALADAVAEAGDEARASALYEDALRRFRAANELQGVAIVLINLGVRAHDRGELDHAAALYEEALAIGYELGDTTSIAVALGNLGEIALDQGRIDEAAGRFRESLRLAWELQDVVTSLQGLVGCGRVAVHAGDVTRGARLLAAAEAHSEAIGVPLQPGERAGFDAATASAMAALGSEEGTRVWQEGRDTELRSVVLAALAAEPPGHTGASPATLVRVPTVHPAHAYDLTRREREILGLLAQRLTDPEIAAQLFISPKTTGKHVSNILGKLGASNRREAAAIAVRDGLL